MPANLDSLYDDEDFLAQHSPRLAWPRRSNPSAKKLSVEKRVTQLIGAWERALATAPDALRVHTKSDEYQLELREAYFLRDLVEWAQPALVKRVTALIVELSHRERMLADAIEEQNEHEERAWILQGGIRALCIEMFFRERCFSVDMSAYQAQIDVVRESDLTAKTLRLLRAYINPSKKLEEAYRAVRDDLVNEHAYATPPTMPTRDQVIEAFGWVLEDIHRRTGAYVSKRLDERARQP